MGLPMRYQHAISNGEHFSAQFCVKEKRDHGKRICSELLTLGLIVEETVNLGGGTVESANGEAVVGSVQNQVLAHNGQTDEAEISTGNMTHRSADIDAGETGAIVSDIILLSIDVKTRTKKTGEDDWGTRVIPKIAELRAPGAGDAPA